MACHERKEVKIVRGFSGSFSVQILQGKKPYDLSFIDAAPICLMPGLVSGTPVQLTGTVVDPKLGEISFPYLDADSEGMIETEDGDFEATWLESGELKGAQFLGVLQIASRLFS